jgi:hypothetical protein
MKLKGSCCLAPCWLRRCGDIEDSSVHRPAKGFLKLEVASGVDADDAPCMRRLRHPDAHESKGEKKKTST